MHTGLHASTCSSYDLWLTHRHIDRQLLTGYAIGSASTAKNNSRDNRSEMPVTPSSISSVAAVSHQITKLNIQQKTHKIKVYQTMTHKHRQTHRGSTGQQ